jgi:hypothetical protein
MTSMPSKTTAARIPPSVFRSPSAMMSTSHHMTRSFFFTEDAEKARRIAAADMPRVHSHHEPQSGFRPILTLIHEQGVEKRSKGYAAWRYSAGSGVSTATVCGFCASRSRTAIITSAPAEHATRLMSPTSNTDSSLVRSTTPAAGPTWAMKFNMGFPLSALHDSLTGSVEQEPCQESWGMRAPGRWKDS